MQTYEVLYSLQFSKNNSPKRVNFKINLSENEIDSLAFLFSKYYNHSKIVIVKGLTFFNEFNKCIDNVKKELENKHSNDEIKRILSAFLKNEFMSQVPQFRKLMDYMQKYYKPVISPDISNIDTSCSSCALNKLECRECKIRYIVASVDAFNENIVDGWDIFLRPMFGMPIMLYILCKTNYEANGVFNSDDLVTNLFARFFSSVLNDNSNKYVNKKMCYSLIDECRKATASLTEHDLEFLLCMLRKNNMCDSPVFAPFKHFVLQLAHKTKIKIAKLNKIASVIFTGFYLRLYLESASKRIHSTPFDLELRNVCRFILQDYNAEKFNNFMYKLSNIREDLSTDQYIITEKNIRQMILKYNLDEDLSYLLNKNE
ncbi:P48 [Urbanus proteus nucleopolyhedrovirus]|uniref:P48 n=1 Tax=Urbanus proteus nucleopolyhedrovirus TaxID=1675866 RepID=A0A162GUY6_9ABAC|nr:P48 [Urbanus proteus nucleopolyhedrovirus]AKR17379.1 P48 [Urbanus proteus nucleopolyhedrovirus]